METTGGSGTGLTVSILSVDRDGGITDIEIDTPGTGYQQLDVVRVGKGDAIVVVEVQAAVIMNLFTHIDAFKYFENEDLGPTVQDLGNCMQTVAKAIVNIEKKNYMYTDLKPKNVFVCDEHDKRPTFKIGDLGGLYHNQPK